MPEEPSFNATIVHAQERLSLQEEYPLVAVQWHPTLNVDLTPADVTATSKKKVWWQCSVGSDHIWDASISNRAKLGSSCPYCAKRKVLAGFNDLATVVPELATEWHPTKNEGLLPSHIMPTSAQKVWWLGKDCGHEWAASLTNRNRKIVQGCPYCSGNSILVGFNDLATKRPDVAAFWDFTKNATLTPQMVTAFTKQKIWWKCVEGHEFLRGVNSMSSQTVVGCSYCLGNKVAPGVNDFATLNPTLMLEWDSDVNADIDAFSLAPSSNVVVGWKCAEGHQWTEILRQRKGKSCPTCVDRRLARFNDYAADYPHLLEWWSAKNSLPLNAVPRGDKTLYWWVCKEGHEYQVSVPMRVRRVADCQECLSYAVLGVNDLVTFYPEVVTEWHPTKNGDLQPEKMTVNSDKKVWWNCATGKSDHEWEASIKNRTQRQSGCPHCYAHSFVSKGEKEITEVLDLLGVTYLTSNRTVLQGQEIDIYLPEYKVGIEYNGLYWHSEAQRTDKA